MSDKTYCYKCRDFTVWGMHGCIKCRARGSITRVSFIIALCIGGLVWMILKLARKI